MPVGILAPRMDMGAATEPAKRMATLTKSAAGKTVWLIPLPANIMEWQKMHYRRIWFLYNQTEENQAYQREKEELASLRREHPEQADALAKEETHLRNTHTDAFLKFNEEHCPKAADYCPKVIKDYLKQSAQTHGGSARN